MNTRRLFAGVNSPFGFYSCFQSIINQETANRIIYIKGGPGTGKSTLMKKIAAACEAAGEPVEVFHCSSDPHSLDGVHIVNRKIALMDSTAPHVMEPKYPMVNGEIFNPAVCLNRDKLRGKERELSEYCLRKEAAFNRGFACLTAANALTSAIDGILAQACDPQKVHKTVDDIIEQHLSTPAKTGNGMVRPLFLSAVTPDGATDYQNKLREGSTAVTVRGGANLALPRLIDCAVRNGFDAETFLCPLDPKTKIDHIHIPKLNLWISKEEDDYRSPALDGLRACLKSVSAEAAKAFADAREAHRAMENNVFIPAMDFAQLDQMSDKLKIL